MYKASEKAADAYEKTKQHNDKQCDMSFGVIEDFPIVAHNPTQTKWLQEESDGEGYGEDLYESTGPYSQTMVSGLGKALEIHLQRRWIFPTDIGNEGHLMDTTKFVDSIDPFDLDDEMVHSSSTSSLIDSPGVQISTSPDIFNNSVINADQASRNSPDNHIYHGDSSLVSARTSYEDSPDPEEFLWSIGYYSASGSGSDSGSASNSDFNEGLGQQTKEDMKNLSATKKISMKAAAAFGILKQL